MLSEEGGADGLIAGADKTVELEVGVGQQFGPGLVSDPVVAVNRAVERPLTRAILRISVRSSIMGVHLSRALFVRSTTGP